MIAQATRPQPNKVCYTEDSNSWPRFVKEAFQAFRFEVNHFESNTEAWEHPDKGIRSNPDMYDVYVLDNDTGYQSLKGIQLIQNILQLPKRLKMKFL